MGPETSIATGAGLDATAALGGWLATYWLHAGAAAALTFLLARTLLRGAPAGLRAAAFSAAVVAPLVTSALCCTVGPDERALRVGWLDGPAGPTAAGRGEAAAPTRTAADPAPLRARAERPRPRPDAAPTPDPRSGPRTERPAAGTTRATGVAVERAPLAAVGAVGEAVDAEPRGPLTSIDHRRLALLLAAAAALVALVRWLDGWRRLGARVGRRFGLDVHLEREARALAVRLGVPGTRVVQATGTSVPLALGLLRPCVVLPVGFERGLERDEWRAAVAHELAHVARGDTRWLPLLRLVARLFAFQPLVPLVWRALQRESELAADDLAVEATGDGASLARCLAKVATRARVVSGGVLPAAAATGAPTMAARAALVVERAERLVRAGAAGPRRATRRARLLTLVPTVVLAVGAPRLAPTAGSDAPTAPTAGPAAPASAGAPTGARPHGAAARDGSVDELALAVSLELALLRQELERALGDADQERAPALAELERRLSALEASHARALALVRERGARAKAPRSVPSPTTHSDTDTTR